ncbi:M20/M25/M40 family metallo-hydrolase [Pseudenhygromyxa sp. WMMC2535]|uniref:M20/M25/M40 family metallo-hydrolase n=1 Tax=Pseudenhygromyxa sp. WMMC2535 TaxID=2712867 RepID=UPI00155734F7|nr:M20/M25/M40 family metallo-hydrolase [Pseudenhygromyxa sp. WMMC2535]NVB37488.1 M20/M25/M40 family metallo-hydrolase [Pseudenhygromyxa sp. WMMC2535]
MQRRLWTLSVAPLGLVVGLASAGLAGCRGEPRAVSSEDGPVEPRGSRDAAAGPAAQDPELALDVLFEDPVLRKIVALAEADSQVEDHARVLAVDIGARLTGSAGLVEAELWAQGQLRDWGLEARREAWGELPVGFERGPARGAMIRPERQTLEFGTWAWTPGTGEPVRGQALLYPQSDAELRKREPYLRGAWVLVPRVEGRPLLPQGELGERVARALDKAGIAGLVYAAGDPEDTLIHTWGRPWIDWDALPRQVEIRLRGDQHHELSERVAAGEYVQLEFAVDNHFVDGPLTQHNVIAELRGDERPEEVVIIGGHLDSWDGAAGAVDNATGVATAMEAARLIAAACEATGERPARTIRVMLWTGEEQGLLGSTAWVEANAEALAGISAVFVHDNGTNPISGLPVTPEMLPQMREVFAPVAALERRRAALDPEGEAMEFRLRVAESLIVEPSDSAPFIDAGVPAFFWEQRGRSDYDYFHHTQHDSFAAIIDDYQRRSALIVAFAAWGVAEADALVERHNSAPLPPRRLGVALEGNQITGLTGDSLGAAAGMDIEDRIVEIEGEAVGSAREITDALQRGGPRKQVVIQRGGERLELGVDWSGSAGETERLRRREERAQVAGPESGPDAGE